MQQPSHIWGVSPLFWKRGCGLQITASNPTPTQSIPLRRPPNFSSSFQPSLSEELSVPLPHSQSPPSSDCALCSLQSVPFILPSPLLPPTHGRVSGPEPLPGTPASPGPLRSPPPSRGPPPTSYPAMEGSPGPHPAPWITRLSSCGSCYWKKKMLLAPPPPGPASWP